MAFFASSARSKIRHELRASMAVTTYASKDRRIEELVPLLSWNRLAAITFVNEVRFFVVVLKWSCRRTECPFVNITTRSIFEIGFFSHCLPVLSDRLQKKILTVPQNHRAGTLIGFYVQRLLKTLNKLFSGTSFTDFFEAGAPCMLFDNSISQF